MSERLAEAIVRGVRNAPLRLIGWRRTDELKTLCRDEDDFGAVYLATWESRPWWECDRLVDRKLVDWMDMDEARERVRGRESRDD